ncbi:MAG: tripartite tricarboxylate transporter permease [Planctomycetota bacterium]
MSQALFAFLASPQLLLMTAIGTWLGIIVGAMPGLTGAMLIALSLPLTFSMAGDAAMVLLVSMYVGSVSGGLVTATLLKIPGTPASMMTTLDGYPLAQQGRANHALGLGVGASLAGGLIGWCCLLFMSAPLAKMSVQLGPFEYFSLVLVALVLIAGVSGKSLTKGIFAGSLGLLLALPGTNPGTGQPRWTGGVTSLEDGLKLLPVLIGLFAMSQVFFQVQRIDSESFESTPSSGGSTWFGSWVALCRWGNWLRSGLLGTFIGILPGVGANIGSVVAYSTAKSLSKEPDQFGKGSEEGIVASEAANNASVGGALIPLFAMGIPGSVIDAILLGALTIHGLQPGPLLIEQNPALFQTLLVSVLLSNLLMFLTMGSCARYLVRLSRLPHALLLPTIITLCVLGSFALANRMFDVWVMLGMGGIGILFNRQQVPLSPFVIGFVLAPIAETHLVEGLTQSGGSWLPLLTRPVSALLLSLAGLVLAIELYQCLRSLSRAGASSQPQ